jgi:hypothetical protein
MNAISSVHAMGVRVSGRIAEEHVDTLREMMGWEKGRAALDLTEVMSAGGETWAACGQRSARRTESNSETVRPIYASGSLEKGCHCDGKSGYV